MKAFFSKLSTAVGAVSRSMRFNEPALKSKRQRVGAKDRVGDTSPDFLRDDMWWDWRRGPRPVANNLLSIHEMCLPFFEALDPSLVVYVHGSFARALQVESSDINLYIPSHSRCKLEEVWIASSMRKPSFSNPDVSESIEQRLRDDLGRVVTICCLDDPWHWVKRDLKFQIYPLLEGEWPATHTINTDRRKDLLQIARKCWYSVLTFEVEYASGTHEVQHRQNKDSGPVVAFTHDLPGVSLAVSQRGLICLAIYELYYLLSKTPIMEWEQYLPELPSIPSLIVDLKPHVSADEKAYVLQATSQSYWEQEREYLHECASKIKLFETVVFPNEERLA